MQCSLFIHFNITINDIQIITIAINVRTNNI